jgi:hypothetical protein
VYYGAADGYLGLLAARMRRWVEAARHFVATHVRNILSKTRSANRTEAAACALRQGLVEG